MSTTKQLTYVAAREQKQSSRYARGPARAGSLSQGSGVTQNVGQAERLVSAASGAILAMLGLARRDLTGLIIAGVGGGLGYRAISGYCPAYKALGLNSASSEQSSKQTALREKQGPGVAVDVAFLINKPPEDLYRFWRNFENLPQFMSHLQSVKRIDDKRSHWVTSAPTLLGGNVEWDAEIVEDQPGHFLAWRTVSQADVEHHGAIRFERAPADRGTQVRVTLEYQPPAGRVGKAIATLFGAEPEQQIRDDLRNFKRLMETGEVPCTSGQPHGTCGIRLSSRTS